MTAEKKDYSYTHPAGIITLFMMAIFLFLPVISHAATIRGDVYTYDLKKASDVKVVVNSIPRQQVVSPTGDYSLFLPKGNYTLSAYQIENNRVIAEAEEDISILDSSGEYSLDIILFPVVEEDIFPQENLIIEDPYAEKAGSFTRNRIFLAITILLSLIILYIIMLKILKKKYPVLFNGAGKMTAGGYKKDKAKRDDLPDDLRKVIDIIKKEGGRIKQADLKKKLFPLSESKISLMITHLEKIGLVGKIKKGRGNIIILK